MELTVEAVIKDINMSLPERKINQLIEQNIVLNIQPAQNELILKYIREIEASNLQKYELKEHLYILNIKIYPLHYFNFFGGIQIHYSFFYILQQQQSNQKS